MGRVWGHFRGVSLESCAPFFSGLWAFFLFGVFRGVFLPLGQFTHRMLIPATAWALACPRHADLSELRSCPEFLHMAQNRQDPFSSSLGQLLSFWFQGVSLSCQVNNWISEAGCLDRVSFRAKPRRVDLRTHGRAPALRATRKKSEAPGGVAQVLQSETMFAARRSPGLPYFWHIHVRRAKPDLLCFFHVRIVVSNNMIMNEA